MQEYITAQLLAYMNMPITGWRGLDGVVLDSHNVLREITAYLHVTAMAVSGWVNPLGGPHSGL